MAKRKYRVTSRANTLGRETGTVFEYDFDKSPYSEQDLIQRGAIEKVKRGEEKRDNDKADE